VKLGDLKDLKEKKKEKLDHKRKNKNEKKKRKLKMKRKIKNIAYLRAALTRNWTRNKLLRNLPDNPLSKIGIRYLQK
jgi:hypothetical protein